MRTLINADHLLPLPRPLAEGFCSTPPDAVDLGLRRLPHGPGKQIADHGKGR